MSQLPNAKEIFADAIDLPVEEREGFVRGACGANAQVLAEVQQLLGTYAGARKFLDTPTIVGGPAGVVAESAGAQIGRYRLLQVIGEGGFGVVFMAEQREPVVRRVALKIIKPGMDTAQVIARFEAERQALALMDHPNIAKVLDAGRTDSGRPYFVMELVKGEPITRYCDEGSLTIPERLELFLQVCRAVQHAHIKGVIHRDINPRNVLVSTQDGRPMARVIDFGIAKAIDRRLTEKTVFTEFRQFIGTPEYMSPEQAGNGVDVDTRTDVYSLGVLLYELLTGSVPFDASRLRSAAFEELRRIIREDEPPKPSTRLSQSKDTIRGVAAQRRVDPERLGTMVRGDLDWIVLKALEKDRARRYESPSNLAADVERHLSGRAVLAAPPSAAYRVRKFVVRHRVGAIAGGLVAAALVAGLGAALWQAGVAARERDAARKAAAEAIKAKTDADQRRQEVEVMGNFQASQLKGIDVAAMGTRLRDQLLEDARASMERAHLSADQIHARQEQFRGLLADVNLTNVALASLDETIFVRALKAVDEQFKDQPDIRAGLLLTIADTLMNLGLNDRAMEPMAQGLEIRRRLQGDDAPVTLKAIVNMGSLLKAQGKLAEAEALCREALERCRRVLGNEDPDTLTAANNLAVVLQNRGKLAEAEPLYLEVLQARRRVAGPDDKGVIIAVGNMGFLLQAQGKLAQAEPYFKEAMDRSRVVMGQDDQYTLRCISNYGSFLQLDGRAAEAEPYLREALDKRRHMLGEDHPDTLRSLANMGVFLDEMGRTSEAVPLFVEALEKSRRRWPADHPFVIQATGNLGHALHRQGKLAEAEPLLREALERDRRVLMADHRDTLISLCRLAELRGDQGDLSEAESLFREAIDGFTRTQGQDATATAFARTELGEVLTIQGRYPQAEESLLRAEGDLHGAHGGSPSKHIRCVKALVKLYEAWDKAQPGNGYDAKAALWQAKVAPEPARSPAPG